MIYIAIVDFLVHIIPKVKVKQQKRTNPIAPPKHKQRNQTKRKMLAVDSDGQQKSSLQGGRQTDRDCK